MSVPISVLDLAVVPSGVGSSAALERVRDLARLADRAGYRRLWFAEHHGMGSIASSAPELLISHAASVTERIRVGAGGIMLPNHAPLKVAELFRTLRALHGDRIDLGLGRAPGSDLAASRALRAAPGEQFPQLLAELFALTGREGFEPPPLLRGVRAMPDDVPLPPLWILGSSGASAAMAGQLGLGYGFATHFSPAPAWPSITAYREAFVPSPEFPEPHAIVVVSAVCAETAEEAEYLSHSYALSALRIRRGEFLPLPSPDEALAYPYSGEERAALEQIRRRFIVGDPSTVSARIEAFASENAADEVMVMSSVHDHAARLRSYELVARAVD